MYLIFLMVQKKNVAKRKNETIKKLRDIKFRWIGLATNG